LEGRKECWKEGRKEGRNILEGVKINIGRNELILEGRKECWKEGMLEGRKEGTYWKE
jgi:hypothetical protein